ncbi:LAMI_0D08790g1_1 [Lachancea mirantina]|uniref:Biogenesis of lysosome-related organelles complex 1 subunit KXD1 n=1 Tax=Lachancea mirantina TaxID=1230905 RepID=A0A1G4JD53_9SACH|nr:LAMI_0D08790g1_1 [Lachancea mirantina]
MSSESPTGSSIPSRTPSIDSRIYSIPDTVVDLAQTDESSSEDDLEADNDSEDAFLNQAVAESSSMFLMSQIDTPMFDASRYIFQSLTQSMNSVDFSEAIALQTRTSGLINSKSRELKRLTSELEQRLLIFQDKFEKGAASSKRIKYNLRKTSETIKKINAEFERQYPIEFNQARELIFERPFED